MPRPTQAARVTTALLFLLLAVVHAAPSRADARFSVATYNVENYLLQDTATRRAKPPAARAAVARSVARLQPDVIALQEVGGMPALDDLRSRLRDSGLHLPHAAVVHGPDTNIQLALLSRFPVRHLVAHTNDSFLLDGRRHRVSRGFLEAELDVAPRCRVTVLAAHLKSKRVVVDSAESDLRENEARLLREHVDALLRRDPGTLLVVCGDLNDTPESRPVRIVTGTGLRSLVDTRPAEPVAGPESRDGTRGRPRRVNWTHYYATADTFTRIDYLLVSRALARSWRPEGTRVLVDSDWGEASDHRPIVAEFVVVEGQAGRPGP